MNIVICAVDGTPFTYNSLFSLFKSDTTEYLVNKVVRHERGLFEKGNIEILLPSYATAYPKCDRIKVQVTIDKSVTMENEKEKTLYKFTLATPITDEEQKKMYNKEIKNLNKRHWNCEFVDAETA